MFNKFKLAIFIKMIQFATSSKRSPAFRNGFEMKIREDVQK